MSVHIDSETRSNGYRYQGTWTFNQSIQGQYTILEQYIDPQDIPWITHNINKIDMDVGEHSVSFTLLSTTDSSFNTLSVSDDLATIATYIQTRFNAIFTTLEVSVTCTVTNDTANQRFNLVFSSPITLVYSDMDLRYVFLTGSNDITGTSFYWYTKNIDLKPHLYLKIPEVDTTIEEPDVSDGAILFHTEGNALTGMNIVIRNATNTLTINIYRSSIPNYTIPIENKWDLVLLAN